MEFFFSGAELDEVFQLQISKEQLAKNSSFLKTIWHVPYCLILELNLKNNTVK